MLRMLLGLSLLTWMATAQAAALDSRQYGFLQTGQRQETVAQRYGAPDQVVREAPIVGAVRTGPGTAAASVVQYETWVYQGDSTSLSTVIRFRNGVVETFHKQR